MKLIGNDGSTRRSTRAAADRTTLIPMPGGNATAPIGPDALSLARAQAVQQGAAWLIGADGTTLVGAGGLE